MAKKGWYRTNPQILALKYMNERGTQVFAINLLDDFYTQNGLHMHIEIHIAILSWVAARLNAMIDESAPPGYYRVTALEYYGKYPCLGYYHTERVVPLDIQDELEEKTSGQVKKLIENIQFKDFFDFLFSNGGQIKQTILWYHQYGQE